MPKFVLIFFTMIALCTLLDCFVLFGDITSPVGVADRLCDLRTIGNVSSFLFSDGWSLFVRKSCETSPIEPVASIVALMIKAMIVVVALILTIAIYPLREKRGKSEQNVDGLRQTQGVPISGLTGWTLAIALFCLPAALGWHLVTAIAPLEYRVSLLQKAYEDIFLLAAYLGGIVLWIAFCELALLPILRRVFPNQAWARMQ